MRKMKAMRFSARKTGDSTITVFMILVVIGIIGGGIYRGVQYLKYQTNLFMLKNIEVKGNSYIPEKRILKLANIQTDVKLFTVNADTIRQRILTYKYIKSVIVKPTLPATLTIIVQERQPELYLADGKIYFIDQDGLILLKPRTMPMKELPVVAGRRVSQLLKNRQPIYKVLNLMQIIREVDPELVHFISGFFITPKSDVQLQLKPHGVTVILDPQHPYSKLYALAEFLKNPVNFNRLKYMKMIDLRFNNRLVVRFKTSQKGSANRG